MSTHDDALVMELAIPSNPDEACRMLQHPVVHGLKFAEHRASQGDKFYRRLAGSLRQRVRLPV